MEIQQDSGEKRKKTKPEDAKNVKDKIVLKKTKTKTVNPMV